MTKTTDEVQKFIELRARGLSFDKIATETGTSKPTLLKWARDYQQELEQAQYFEVQNLLSQYEVMRRNRVEVVAETLSMARLTNLMQICRRCFDRVARACASGQLCGHDN